MNGFRWNFA